VGLVARQPLRVTSVLSPHKIIRPEAIAALTGTKSIASNGSYVSGTSLSEDLTEVTDENNETFQLLGRKAGHERSSGV